MLKEDCNPYVRIWSPLVIWSLLSKVLSLSLVMVYHNRYAILVAERLSGDSLVRLLCCAHSQQFPVTLLPCATAGHPEG